MRVELDMDRALHMVDYAIRVIFALANHDSEKLPAEPPEMDDRAEWATLNIPLEIIKRKMPQATDDAFIVVEAIDGKPIGHSASALAGQIVATYCNGDKMLALELWAAATNEMAGEAGFNIYQMAASCVKGMTEDEMLDWFVAAAPCEEGKQ